MERSRGSLVHPKYRPDIDGLRAISVIAVVAFHAYPKSLPGGFIGVDVFFVISGFLISTILFESLREGHFSLIEFYGRRIRRIFPALLVVLTASLVFGWFVLLPEELNQLGLHVLAGAGFFSNFQFWNESGYFDTAAEAKPLLHVWSLAIEEQFYIVFPLLVWIGWRRQSLLPFALVMLALASLAYSISAAGSDSVAAFYSPLSRFWELLSGSLLAWLTLYGPGFGKLAVTDTSVSLVGSSRSILSLIGLILLASGLWVIDTQSSFPGYWTLMPVFGAVLIIAAGSEAWVNRTILSNRLLVWVGLISFPLYLWHWPILSFGRMIYVEPPFAFEICAIALAVLLSWLTVQLIERLARITFSGLKAVPKVLATGMAVLGLTGFGVSRADLSASHRAEDVAMNRAPEFAYGSSLKWYQRSDDWLFLGNSYDDTVAKLMLTTLPPEQDLARVQAVFGELASAGLESGTKIVLIVGPNKESIYPEYLPAEIKPSSRRYVSYFLDRLRSVPNLIVYDPTQDLLSLKEDEGLLYWRTDTHWNQKGSFLTLAGLFRLLFVPVPEVSFRQNGTYSGDLIVISGLEDFPLHAKDNWEVV